MKTQRYFTVTKEVGETPLHALERARVIEHISASVPLAYAGRLDPMASGKLLILVGDECKVQERYHTLDKEYVFEVLLGVTSDTHDVLGIVEFGTPRSSTNSEVKNVLATLTGKITLPYPHFSSKTVQGKPLHMWTLEGKLDTITIPTKTSTIYSLTHIDVRSVDANTLDAEIRKKIASVETVTDERKALGRDFRRVDVLKSWESIVNGHPTQIYEIHTFRCVASSGTYMRTLASLIGKNLGTGALAYSIHRTKIGKYLNIPHVGGFFRKVY